MPSRQRSSGNPSTTFSTASLELLNTFDTIPSALELAVWLGKKLDRLVFPANLRNRLSASCFAVVQDHHRAVVLCLQQTPALHASAFALVRVQYEAYVRGMWLFHCASDLEVEKFSKGAEPPRISDLIIAIDAASNVEGQLLRNLHKGKWRTMCAYAHTGALQVQRWNTGDCIEPNYNLAEIKEVLAFTSMVALLSAMSVTALANNHELAQKIFEKSGIHSPNEI